MIEHLKIGDYVTIHSFEGIHGRAQIIDERVCANGRFKVRMLEGTKQELWAWDHEISGPVESEYQPQLANAPTAKARTARLGTIEHIAKVRQFVEEMAKQLQQRGFDHDRSKLSSPEVEVFDIITSRLRGLTYGSEEYKAVLREQKPAIEHHQKSNRHHPEYHADGVDGMNLIDLLEMICDWKAASMRHADGDIMKSIEINTERFGLTPQLASILRNTAELLNERA